MYDPGGRSNVGGAVRGDGVVYVHGVLTLVRLTLIMRFGLVLNNMQNLVLGPPKASAELAFSPFGIRTALLQLTMLSAIFGVLSLLEKLLAYPTRLVLTVPYLYTGPRVRVSVSNLLSKLVYSISSVACSGWTMPTTARSSAHLVR